MKAILKFALILLVYSVLYTLSYTLLPFSQGFMDSSANANPVAMLYMIINNAWICFTGYFMVMQSRARKSKQIIAALIAIIISAPFLTQIETLFFGSAFSALTALDVVFIMLAGIIPLLASIPLTAKFFGNPNGGVSAQPAKADNGKLIKYVLITGLIYVAVYFIFGYFVAWTSEDLRVFYSGSPENLGFWGQITNNWRTNPVIFPFQYIRGVIFASAVIPLLCLSWKHSKDFIISVCLVYQCAGVGLLVPNFLFPDVVRLRHFVEMSASMLLFGLIVGFMLSKCKNISNSEV